MTAEELLRAVGDGYNARGITPADDRPGHELRAILGPLGYTPLDYLRARLWLRRDKPADSAWDESCAGWTGSKP